MVTVGGTESDGESHRQNVQAPTGRGFDCSLADGWGAGQQQQRWPSDAADSQQPRFIPPRISGKSATVEHGTRTPAVEVQLHDANAGLSEANSVAAAVSTQTNDINRLARLFISSISLRL
jgi:hypothetical protein